MYVVLGGVIPEWEPQWVSQLGLPPARQELEVAVSAVLGTEIWMLVVSLPHGRQAFPEASSYDQLGCTCSGRDVLHS